MTQLNQQVIRFTLNDLEQKTVYWINCQMSGQGGINKVIVVPDKKVDHIPDKIKNAVNHHFELVGYTGLIEYQMEPSSQ